MYLCITALEQKKFRERQKTLKVQKEQESKVERENKIQQMIEVRRDISDGTISGVKNSS